MGRSLPFVLQNFPHYVGDLQVFASYPEPIPTYVPGWGGGVGVYFDWCIIVTYVNIMDVTFGKKLVSFRPNVLFPTSLQMCLYLLSSKLWQESKIFGPNNSVILSTLQCVQRAVRHFFQFVYPIEIT